MKIHSGDFFEYKDYFGNKNFYIAIKHVGNDAWSMLVMYKILHNSNDWKIYGPMFIGPRQLAHFTKLNQCQVTLPSFSIQ